VGKPVLHLNGHYDVVPVGVGWTVDPFAGTVRDGMLFGRGASDMKGGVASMIMTAIVLKRFGINLKGSLFFSAVPDEETGGAAGTGYLVGKGYGKADMAIVPEPDKLDMVTIGYRGAQWVEITSHGKAAHGGMPHLGVNAVEKMAKVIMRLQNLKRRFEGKVSQSPIIPVESRHATLNIGTIQGGF